MALANELTRKVLAILLERGEKQVPSVNLAGITTQSLEAFKDFLRGERRLRAGAFEAAAEAFEAAIQKDSTFALAYARRGAIGDWIGSQIALGKSRFWTQAHRQSDRLPRRTRRLVEGVYRSRNHPLAAADTLRRLTEAYPDDPRMWYCLGEVLWHARVPGGRPESERAFARAVELDPGNAMYYPHYVQGAFTVHHDSALAARRIAALPKRQWREAYQTPMNVAFGDSAAQAAALARLDSVQRATGGVLGLSMPLYRSPLYQEPLEDKLRREARESDRDATYLFHARLLWGHLQTALRQMQDLRGRVDPGPGQIGYVLARSMSVGIPIPDSILHAHLDPSRLGENPSLLQLKGTALYLIEQGRAAELGPLLERIRTKTGPDAQVVRELKGYRAFAAGELERAAALWADVGESTFWVYGSIWRGDLHRRLGQL
jgi:tetratricopeptide (TPR) repeat protein